MLIRKITGPDSSSGRASASGAGGRRFETRPRHTKGVKNGTTGYLAWRAQHYKASTGFSHSLLTQLTLQKKKKKKALGSPEPRLMSPSGVKTYRKIDRHIDRRKNFLSTTIFALPLIQEGLLSVTGERVCAKYW